MQDLLPELRLDPVAFSTIADVAYKESGLTLPPEKRLMVQSRLRHRLRALSMPDFDAYAQFVKTGKGAQELPHMISALTTNVSHFFREAHHFDTFAEWLTPRLQRKIDRREAVRIWSAGASNGQEPYSIAMHLALNCPGYSAADVKILATDIDPRVLRFAQRGVYNKDLLRGLPEAATQFFDPVREATDQFSVRADIRKLVHFRELNLLKPWPMRHAFDAIFCRNVVIYFDTPTQAALWPRFNGMLADQGLFFLGHSERIPDPVAWGFRSVGPTTYTKL